MTETELQGLPIPEPHIYKIHGEYRAFYLIHGSRIARSRYVMEQHLGRELRPDEEVHHMNGITTDDRIENLRLLSHHEHNSLHHLGSKDEYLRRHPAGGCIISKMIGNYGPYLYHVRWVDRKHVWTYLGRADRLVRDWHQTAADSEPAHMEEVVE